MNDTRKLVAILVADVVGYSRIAGADEDRTARLRGLRSDLINPVIAANHGYRIKSKAEPFARVAKETDLVAVGLPPSKQAAAAPWANPVSARWLPRAVPIAVTTSTNFRPAQTTELCFWPHPAELPAPRETTRGAAFPRPTARDGRTRGCATE
jgi:class 3 adenylate cyclase